MTNKDRDFQEATIKFMEATLSNSLLMAMDLRDLAGGKLDVNVFLNRAADLVDAFSPIMDAQLKALSVLRGAEEKYDAYEAEVEQLEMLFDQANNKGNTEGTTH